MLSRTYRVSLFAATRTFFVALINGALNMAKQRSTGVLITIHNIDTSMNIYTAAFMPGRPVLNTQVPGVELLEAAVSVHAQYECDVSNAALRCKHVIAPV